MCSINVLFSSIRGKTKEVANKLPNFFPNHKISLHDMRKLDPRQLSTVETTIFCVPTYGMGDMDRYTRTFLERCDHSHLQNRNVLLIGLGDQVLHGKTFAESLLHLSKQLSSMGALLSGSWSAEGYSFEASQAVDMYGNFPGLVLDEVNQSEMSDKRLRKWLERVNLYASKSSAI